MSLFFGVDKLLSGSDTKSVNSFDIAKTQKVTTKESTKPLAIMTRVEFVAFARAAISDKSSPEYKVLYQFLLDCFRSADCDYDGKVDAEEFDMMVELAAKDVRRLGLAPTHQQSYKSLAERRAARAKLFQAMDADKSGFIGFEEWLQYSVKHIAEKVKHASVERSPRLYGSKEEFLRFVTAATQSRASAEYKEFYSFLLECFVEADQDMDGKVNLAEFDKMVEKAGAFPRSHGLAPQTTEQFKTDEERIAGRKKHFESMDADKSGYISFEEWLEFTYLHVLHKLEERAVAKPAGVPDQLAVKQPKSRCQDGCLQWFFTSKKQTILSAVPSGLSSSSGYGDLAHMSRGEFIAFCRTATSDTSSSEYEKLYQYLLDCFRRADNDYDGKVDAEEFDMMVELAAKDVRRLGLAPTHKQTYRSSAERLAARKQLFEAMDADNSGFIGFEEWLTYSVKHIAEKVKSAPLGNTLQMTAGKSEFLQFAIVLAKSRASAEYKDFYNFLLECFVEADQDRDGKVNLMEFDKMVDRAAALPRMYGLAPVNAEMFKTEEQRIAARKKHFDAMDADKSGYISFEEWLGFTYLHVCEKVRGLASSAGFEQGLDLGTMSREEFIAFNRQATSDKSSPEYRKLYQFLLDCFRSADNDYDGKVNLEEFDMMVELAAKDVRRLGFAPTHKQMYKSRRERLAARLKLFQVMDADGSGFIGFEEWLQYAMKHIAEKVTQVPVDRMPNMRGSKEEFLRFVKAATQSRESAEYKEFYNFLLECFVEADEDMDGGVNFLEFDRMVEKAGAFPRSHGLAPPTAELFKTDAERLAGRRKHFEAMDADNSGFISFEEWLEFTYAHVCKKVEQLGA